MEGATSGTWGLSETPLAWRERAQVPRHSCRSLPFSRRSLRALSSWGLAESKMRPSLRCTQRQISRAKSRNCCSTWGPAALKCTALCPTAYPKGCHSAPACSNILARPTLQNTLSASRTRGYHRALVCKYPLARLRVQEHSVRQQPQKDVLAPRFAGTFCPTVLLQVHPAPPYFCRYILSRSRAPGTSQHPRLQVQSSNGGVECCAITVHALSSPGTLRGGSTLW